MGQKTILFVDDDESCQISVGQHLTIISKITVVGVENGIEALKVLATDQKFDCILLDRRMPEMDGGQFLKEYKGNLPIIIASGNEDLKDPRIIASFPKPCDCIELGKFINNLEKHLRSASADDQPACEAGPPEAAKEDSRA